MKNVAVLRVGGAFSFINTQLVEGQWVKLPFPVSPEGRL